MPPRSRSAQPEHEGGAQDFTPISAEAESSVLAALLTNPEVFDEVSTRLDPESFGVFAHAEIYRAIVACDNAGKPFDQITVADELKRAKVLTKLGGSDTLSRLVSLAPLVSNIEAHVDIILDKALRRRLMGTGREIATDAMDPSRDARDALASAEQRVFDLGKAKQQGSLVEMAQAVPEMLKELAKTRTSLLVGHGTGFKEMDRLTAGFQGGQFIILAGRPSMGKSALGLQLARNLAESSGAMVPFLSYEMGTSELTMRMLATAVGYDLHKLRRGDLPPGMDRELAIAAEKMAQLSVLIDDNPPETIGGVRSEMRRLARRGPIGAIVIDYLQLMSAESRHQGENRTQEVSEISRGLKRLATELNVPVIALSQLNRGLEQRPNKRPMLSDLRESGSLEQDASMVMFVYRDSVYNAVSDPSLAECIVAKQRNGPTGVIHLDFTPECARFSTTDRRPQAMAAPSSGGKGGNGNAY